MKKISISTLVVLGLMIFVSCEQDEFRSFKDYDYTTAYFPYQYPVRTLILGDYTIADNSRDNELKFLISARIGGVYKNKSDVVVKFQIDESLVNNLLTNPNQWDGKTTATSDTLAVLPSKYYTFSNSDKIIIPAGSYHGGVEIQLTQDFLNDPKSWTTHYVVPLRITSATTDSVLSGKSNNPNADPRIMTDWEILPKDFTVFGIKFVNAYHGAYFHKGKSIITVQGSSVSQTIHYSAIDPLTGIPTLEKNEVWSLQTTGKNRVKTTGRLRDVISSPGEFKIYIDFVDGGENCIVTDTEDSLFPVTGTGKVIKGGDTWGGKPRDVIYLNYKVTNGAYTSTITDTLVFRDKGITFQEFSPELDLN